MRRPIVFALTIAAIATLTLFQNCAPTQNFDLEQTAQASLTGADGSADVPAPPVPTPEPAATPAPTPEPEPEPTPTPAPSPATAGAYCPIPSARLPKLKAAFVDLQGVDLQAGTSLSSLKKAGRALSGLDVYYEHVNFGRLPAAERMTLGTEPIRAEGGAHLKRNYLVEYEGYLQLPSGARTTTYQLGASFSGLLSVEIETPGASGLSTLIDHRGGVDQSRFVCGATVHLRVSDQARVRIRHVHGGGEHTELALFLRPVTSENTACSLVGALFDGSNPVKGLASALGAGGWFALKEDNYVLARDGANLLVNGGFETGNNLNDNSSEQPGSLAGWKSANSVFERWSRGYEGLPASEGRHFLELDVHDTSGKPDAIYQTLTLDKNAKYRFISEHARRPQKDGDLETNQVHVAFLNRQGSSYVQTLLGTVAGPGNKQWAGYAYVVSPSASEVAVAFAERSDRNDSAG